MAHLVITTKCNNNCVSCINHKDNRNGVNTLQMYKDIKEMLKQEKHISIGGGEPTIHPEFFDILALVDSFGVEYTLLTNGRAFSNKAFSDRFLTIAKNNPRIAISLYGHDDKTHDSTTRSPGSYSQTINGIRNLKGSRIELRLIVTGLNYRTLPLTAKLSEKLPHDRIMIVGMKMTGEAKQNLNISGVLLTDTLPYVKESLDTIKGDAYTLHYPHCILGDYKKYSYGKTIEDEQIHWDRACDGCIHRDDCSGVWKSYFEEFGFEEFGYSKKH